MTINEVISLFQKLLKEYTSDTHYTPGSLWKIYTLSKARLIKQRLDKFKKVSDSNYTTVCIDTENSLSHVCGCITNGCKVKKTKFQLPAYLSGRNKDTLLVTNLQGKTIDRFKEEDYEEIKLDEIKANKPKYDIKNNHIILFDCSYDKIQVKAIWGDILDLEEIKSCNNDDCVDYFNTQVDNDYDLHYAAFQECFNLLRLPLSLMSDLTSDTNEEIKK